MKYLPVLGLALLLAFQSCSTVIDETASSAVKSVPERMDESTHGFDLVKSLSNSSIIGSRTNQVLSTDTISDNFYLTQYIGGNRFLGTVIWTVENGNFNPIWQEKDSSDFPPHTFSFVHFNNDGRKDLTVLLGQEDVFGTDVYINQSTKTYSKDNFKLAYQNWNDYSVIVDINGDGVPELLDSGHAGTEHVEGPEFFLNDEVLEKVHQKYNEIAQVKGANNFHFNMPNHFKVFNSFLLDSIKILGFENGKFADKTCRYQGYLDWRIAILKKIKADSRNDSKRIEDLINYLEKKKICI